MKYTSFDATLDPITVAYNQVMQSGALTGKPLLHSYPVDLSTPQFKARVMEMLNAVKDEFANNPASRVGIHSAFAHYAANPSITHEFNIQKAGYDGNDYDVVDRILYFAERVQALQAAQKSGKKIDMKIEKLEHYTDLVIASDNIRDTTAAKRPKYSDAHLADGVKLVSTLLQPHLMRNSHEALFTVASSEAAKPMLDKITKLLPEVSEKDATLALALILARKNELHSADTTYKDRTYLLQPTDEEIKIGVASMKAGILSDHKISYSHEMKGHQASELVSLVAGQAPQKEIKR